MFFSTTTSVSTLLHVLAASASIPFVAAQFNANQFIAKISSTAAPPGYNVEGGTVFDNFVNALNSKQLFTVSTGSYVSEMNKEYKVNLGSCEEPESEPPQLSSFYWCSDLKFSDFSNSSLMGYAGRCVHMFLPGYANENAAGAGAQVCKYEKGQYAFTFQLSAVYVEQLNIFHGQMHPNVDNWVSHFWDDGRKTMPLIGWETHDEGDTGPDAATRSWSGFAEDTWMSVEEVAQMFNTSVDEFTPDKFKQVYFDAWIKEHEDQAKIQTNTNAEAALAIIQVKNGANSTDEIVETPPAQPDTEEDGDTDADAPIDDGSASGRKLASVAARFVSAALRVFGI